MEVVGVDTAVVDEREPGILNGVRESNESNGEKELDLVNRWQKIDSE